MRAVRASGTSSPTRPSLVGSLFAACLLVVPLVLACRLYSDLSVRRAVSRALCLGSVVSEGGTCLLWQVPLSRVPAHFPVAPRIRGRSFMLEYFTLLLDYLLRSVRTVRGFPQGNGSQCRIEWSSSPDWISRPPSPLCRPHLLESCTLPFRFAISHACRSGLRNFIAHPPIPCVGPRLLHVSLVVLLCTRL